MKQFPYIDEGPLGPDHRGAPGLTQVQAPGHELPRTDPDRGRVLAGSGLEVRLLDAYPQEPDGVTVLMDCAGWGDGRYHRIVRRHWGLDFWDPFEMEDDDEDEEG